MSKAIFKFRRNDRIGCAAAEDDHEYLSTCFVDTGCLEILQDMNDNRQIIIGRTGTGKSALIAKLEEKKHGHVINISPENLALTYVTNSTILKFFEKIGVNLDPFFKLLWRHVFTVEILSKHFESKQEVEKKSIFDWIIRTFSGDTRKDKEIREAVEYLKEWGSSFWLETEFRIKEITQKLENNLGAEVNAQLGVKPASLGSVIKGHTNLSQEQKAELCSRGQKIVSTAQVQDLYKVINLLDSVLDDRQKQYYVVIDKLDENWVEEKLRYKLIMALIVTARDLIKVKNAKAIIAMRRDLMDRVFRLCRDSGFQEEKYQSLYLTLIWKKDDLVEILDRRIDMLVKRQYTKQKVTHLSLLPEKFDRIPITDYIIQRANRPRDIISFFNKCIETAPDLSRLSTAEFNAAEVEYSRTRLRALGDEWSADYPNLLAYVVLLRQRPHSFKVVQIGDQEIEDLCLDLVVDNPSGQGILHQQANGLVNDDVSTSDFKRLLIHVFYKIGLVGLKLQPHETESWVGATGKRIAAAELTEDISVVIHPSYYRALGVKFCSK